MSEQERIVNIIRDRIADHASTMELYHGPMAKQFRDRIAECEHLIKLIEAPHG